MLWTRGVFPISVSMNKNVPLLLFFAPFFRVAYFGLTFFFGCCDCNVKQAQAMIVAIIIIIITMMEDKRHRWTNKKNNGNNIIESRHVRRLSFQTSLTLFIAYIWKNVPTESNVFHHFVYVYLDFVILHLSRHASSLSTKIWTHSLIWICHQCIIENTTKCSSCSQNNIHFYSILPRKLTKYRWDINSFHHLFVVYVRRFFFVYIFPLLIFLYAIVLYET